MMILALVAGTSAFAPVMPKTRWVSAVNGLGDADYVKEIEDYKKDTHSITYLQDADF